MDGHPSKKSHNMVAPPPPNLSISGLSICKDCNLVFYNESALEIHNKTLYHENVCRGLTPSFGNFFCFLCWSGFLTNQELSSHYMREIHEQKALDHDVKAIWMSGNHRANEFLKCQDCRLEFVSANHKEKHLSSYSHREVTFGKFKSSRVIETLKITNDLILCNIKCLLEYAGSY